MDEQTINAIAKIVTGLINQNAILEAANKAYYASIITAVATLLVCIITVYFNNRQTMRVKHKEYVDDYYKYIVRRRISAYELLENFIVSIKRSVVNDKDNENPVRPYHLVFFTKEDLYEAYKLLFEILPQALWLSDDTYDITRELNYIFLRAENSESIVEYGKEYYEKIAEMRDMLEILVARDMLNLYDVETFLKEKEKRKSGFSLVKIKDK